MIDFRRLIRPLQYTLSRFLTTYVSQCCGQGFPTQFGPCSVCCLSILLTTNTQPCISLFADLVTDSLTEFAYDADLAGLAYSFHPHNTGLIAAMNGYNDKISVLAQHVLDKIKTLVVDPRRLEVIKESVRYFSQKMTGTNLLTLALRFAGNTRISPLVNHILYPIIMRDMLCPRRSQLQKKDSKNSLVRSYLSLVEENS